ncbi:MAG: hypothetical protein GC182_06550 [Rhodopseudomonas sp.]|nr:hypothetical protein [Rhodopseudomonas sp.]
MNFRQAIVFAACLLPTAAAPALAQAPWPQPQAQQPAQAPWPAPQQQAPQGGAWPQPQAQPQQAPPGAWPQAQQPAQPPECFKKFVVLRDEAQKRAGAIQAATANKRKPSPKEACGLFNSFSAAEAKMVKYAEVHQADCSIPPQIVKGMKEQHTKTNAIRANICRVAAAGPPRPAGPSLSDALSAPIPDSNNIKTGRGTFDTLSGSPLGK